MLGGLVGGRLGYMLFYNFDGLLADPLSTFAVWDGGLSVYGGFFLSTALGLWFLKRKKVDVFRYSDAAIFGLPFGLWIGRIGCFLIHDHPGTASDFFLAVDYPDGIARHDHGLYLSINGLLLGLFMLWLSRKPRPVGTYIATFAVWYGIARFFLDFYRVADVRYGGLTPAQYFSCALAIFGVWLIFKIRNQTLLWKVQTGTKGSSTEIQK
jgi:phosphatidylglycerol:prolipoprotein diacylglycerol transferase